MCAYKFDDKEAPELDKLFLASSTGADYSVPTLLLLAEAHSVPITRSIWPLPHLGPMRYSQELLKVLGFGVLQLKVLKIITEHLTALC